MKKTVTPFTAQLVTFTTTLPFAEVIARLDAEVNKPRSLQFLAKLSTASTREEIVDLVESTTGGNDFLYFMELNHDKWINIYHADAADTTPPPAAPAVVYTIGNPLIAETFMRLDIRAGHQIPPRLMIAANADRTTSVSYHRPSSLVVHLAPENAALAHAMAVLDDKLERMVERITADAL
ncbi:hypothetical protein H0H81_007912 [Sphagnurus paluster]|uniref:DUF302 domain-containing protein n=1 Tax=Sphagnurus paluster TaxID=117069 RepID=A0A9P7FXN4_9AGAR|nr:hypothetical protein H0H81_007912 [Sphagnurus paluster]